MEELFEFLRSEFDYVFVDLSPLSPAVDVRATTELCDVYLLVIDGVARKWTLLSMLSPPRQRSGRSCSGQFSIAWISIAWVSSIASAQATITASTFEHITIST